MKKLLQKLAESVLSREDLKRIKGGDNPYGAGCPDGASYQTSVECGSNCKGRQTAHCSGLPNGYYQCIC